MLTLLQTPTAAPQAPGVPAAPAPAFSYRTQDQATDVATLRAQVREFRVELAGLEAQWDGLFKQLNNMLKENPARPGVQQTWADVGVQIARVKGEIAYREARLGQQGGGPGGTTNVPAGGGGRDRIPNVAFPAAAVMLMVLGLPVSIAWARRILRGRPQPAPVPHDHTMRLENIERSIDAVAIEVERIAEGQRFVTKILAQRPERVSPLESNADPLAASQAPKALGAGPIEPISVPQREQVRQRIITPH